MALGLCHPCQDKHVQRAAAVLIDGVPKCIRCVRGDGAVRPLFAEPECDLTAVLPPVAEPRLKRGPTLFPMHLEQQEREAHAASQSSVDTRLTTVRIQPKRPSTGVRKPSSVLSAPPAPTVRPELATPETKLQQETCYIQNAYAPIVTYLLQETVAAMAMTMDDYLVRSNSPRYATIRHMAAWLIRKHTRVSLNHIGRRLGCMHHTSVMHGVRKIDAQCHKDRGLAVILDQIAESAHRRQMGKESEIRATRAKIHGALLTTCSYPDLLQAGAA